MLPVSAALAAPADLDRSFGGDGIVSVEGTSGAAFSPESAARMAIGPRDEIVALYSAPAPCAPPFLNCTVDLALSRYDRDGRRDAGFGTGAGAVLTVGQFSLHHTFDLAVGPDGKPVVAAWDRATEGIVVARFDARGHLDPTFGAGGLAPQPLKSGYGAEPAVAVQADGGVLVAAEGESEEASAKLHIARFLANGARDPGFGGGGETVLSMGTRSRPAGLMLGPGGSISIASPECCGGQPLFGGGVTFSRLLANGAPDPGFDGDGVLFLPTPGAQGTIEAAALTPKGGIVATIEEDAGSSARVGNLLRLAPGGALDTGFGGDGRIRLFSRVGDLDPEELIVDPSGRTVGLGWDGDLSFFRLRANGGTDRTFNGGRQLEVSIGADQEGPTALGLQSSGRIIALGESTCCGPRAYSLVRLRGGNDRTRCLGERATIVGTRRADEITGTPRRDVIAALAGRDEVRALSGADLICGGKGRDRLFGGPGRDLVKP
jgi:uncharacterized delta-60 repeat protein